MALTGRQVRQLRSLAHHLDPVVMIGKGDISDGIIAQAKVKEKLGDEESEI